MTSKTSLGVDYGRERVGLALADEGSPRRLATLHNTPNLAEDIGKIVADHHITTVVIGLPRTDDSIDSTWTNEVRAFVHQLTAVLSAEVVLQDEFGTTGAARDRLRQEGKLDVQHRELIDQEAAVIILEDYIGGS